MVQFLSTKSHTFPLNSKQNLKMYVFISKHVSIQECQVEEQSNSSGGELESLELLESVYPEKSNNHTLLLQTQSFSQEE